MRQCLQEGAAEPLQELQTPVLYGSSAANTYYFYAGLEARAQPMLRLSAAIVAEWPAVVLRFSRACCGGGGYMGIF